MFAPVCVCVFVSQSYALFREREYIKIKESIRILINNYKSSDHRSHVPHMPAEHKLDRVWRHVSTRYARTGASANFALVRAATDRAHAYEPAERKHDFAQQYVSAYRSLSLFFADKSSLVAQLFQNFKAKLRAGTKTHNHTSQSYSTFTFLNYLVKIPL